MQRTKPPFRADHVGSLLRSAALKEARTKREAGQITDEQLKAVEGREIDAIIRKQESVGLKSITDGEYRRAFWNYDFLGKLPGVGSPVMVAPRAASRQGVITRPFTARAGKSSIVLPACSGRESVIFQVSSAAAKGARSEFGPAGGVARTRYVPSSGISARAW